MPPSEAEALRDRLAVEIRDSIREEASVARSSHPKVGTMLDAMAELLFDPSLSVQRLKRAAGARDNSISIRFHELVGAPPARYLDRCRMHVAERLLLETALPVWQVAGVLGYSSIQVFSRAFKRHADVRPSHFRARHRRFGRPISLADARFGRRALAGELTSGEAQRLIRHLVDLYVERRVVEFPQAAISDRALSDRTVS
ncbi:MAG: AraC family transcriptional regulator [Acidobacteriota bacterium]